VPRRSFGEFEPRDREEDGLDNRNAAALGIQRFDSLALTPLTKGAFRIPHDSCHVDRDRAWLRHVAAGKTGDERERHRRKVGRNNNVRGKVKSGRGLAVVRRQAEHEAGRREQHEILRVCLAGARRARRRLRHELVEPGSHCPRCIVHQVAQLCDEPQILAQVPVDGTARTFEMRGVLRHALGTQALVATREALDRGEAV